MKNFSIGVFAIVVLSVFGLSACSHMEKNTGRMGLFAVPQEEAQWIRNGDPLVFESENWIPQDMYDVLLDSEMQYLGEFNGVPFFVNRIDVRPYDRLYTKFGRNKFRVYKKEHHDSSQPTHQNL